MSVLDTIAVLGLLAGALVAERSAAVWLGGLDRFLGLRRQVLVAPDDAAVAYCREAARSPARACRIGLRWRQEDGTFVDVCAAGPLTTRDPRLRPRRHYELTLACPPALPLRGVPPLSLTTRLFR